MVNETEEKPKDNTPEFNFWDKIKYLFSSPKTFFELLVNETGISNALVMFIIIEVFLGLFSMFSKPEFISGSFSLVFLGLGGEIFAIIVQVGILFAAVGISQLVAKHFNKEANYSKTFQILVYSSVPPSLFLLVPILLSGTLFSIEAVYHPIILSAVILIPAFIYYTFLAVIGLTQTYNLSNGKAVVVVFTPVVVLGIPALFILLFLFSLAAFS